LRTAYFGELHVHTMNSPDAYQLNVRSNVRDAYRFALGEAIDHSSGVTIQLSQPLDFIAVTDHAEYMAILPMLADPDSELASSRTARALASEDPEQVRKAQFELLMSMGEGKPIDALVEPTLRNRIWEHYVELAREYYRPGEFTTLIGYEWTSAGGPDNGVNLHRNVLFRSDQVPAHPYSSFDSYNPEDLWQWMDQQRAAGIALLAIPHNANLSNGLMFSGTQTFDGRPMDASYAEQRLRNEPVVEITQIKGSSETHPALSPNDEWAGFEILDDLLGGTGAYSEPRGSYVRDAWLTGLKLEEDEDYNPYRFGVIGSTDSHNAASQMEENNYHGKIGDADGTPEARRGGSFINKHHIRYSASGLAGVWAESNTREDIYDALARREVFATTGPRISLRVFGAWQWPEAVLDAHDWVEQAYRDGVPMGRELPAPNGSAQAPELLIWAVKDPASAWLQRVQVIKGWLDKGQPSEQVYDVACADELTPDPVTHRCPDNGATVSLETCDFDKHRGDTQLKTRWRDPDFQPAQRAFYYVRVLENPTCRWSTWDSLRTGLPLATDVPPTIQERAYSSPIWYRPVADRQLADTRQ
ncbi:MAG: DUF3604 domain-containing protein, partial [Spongiibacteraceae bacterium]|nr:DUF3604 domain-containing protein [Spongiibacteraceae bacterium]